MDSQVQPRSPTYLRYNTKYIPAKSGFQNIGAICWWNSLVQSLLSCTSFNEYMSTNKQRFIDNKNKLALAYIALLEKLIVTGTDPVSNDASLGSIHLMNGYIHEVRTQKEKRKKIPNGMEGVQDYFNDFLDLLDDPGVERLFNNKYEYIMRCEHCKNIVVNKRNDAKDTFIEIPRDTRKFKSRSDFCDWVRSHYEIVDEYKCDKCKQVTKNFVRVENLRMLREIIVVFNKWKTNVARWLPRYLQFPALGGTKLTYKLVSQIEHSGVTRTLAGGSFMMASGGHYYCHALRDRYYTFNDSSVSEVDPKPTEKTTVLFYHLMSEDTQLDGEEHSSP